MSMDILEFARAALDDANQAGLRRVLQEIDGPQGRIITIDNKPLLNFSSNNYLSLANDPRIIEAAKVALERYGVGSGASRLISGSMRPHRELEERIAGFMNREEAILFNSGYHANIGLIPALVGRDDEIFADKLCHASLIDGSILSRAACKRYPHRDLDALEKLLKASKKGKKLIITDGIFSMEGSIAPLAGILELADRYGSLVYIDDAHGVGVLGKEGRGTLESLNLRAGSNVIEMGTFGKAFGTFGAFVTADKVIIEFLKQKARSFIYTTALPPAIACATIKAIEIVKSEPERRDRLTSNVGKLREGLSSIIGEASGAHIVRILIGEAGRAIGLSKKLFDEGFFVKAIRPPTVPKGHSMLRVTVMSEHSERDIEGFTKAVIGGMGDIHE